MKRSLCRVPGCFNLTDARYCEAHAYKQAEDDRRAADGATRRWAEHHASNPVKAALYRTKKWREIKARLLAMPCALCGGKAASVDHIDNRWSTIEEGLIESNLRPLCARCHNAKSQIDSRRVTK